MNSYDKLLILLQQMCKSAPNICLTTMETDTSCKFNELILESDDLLIAEHLKSGWYIPNGDTMQYIEPIKAGDTIMVMKLSDEKYAIIERLVSI